MKLCTTSIYNTESCLNLLEWEAINSAKKNKCIDQFVSLRYWEIELLTISVNSNIAACGSLWNCLSLPFLLSFLVIFLNAYYHFPFFFPCCLSVPIPTLPFSFFLPLVAFVSLFLSSSFPCHYFFSFFNLPFSLSFLVSLLVVWGAALPLAGVVHARRADGAGDEVGGAGGHEVSHCRRDVHPLVCHQVIYRETKSVTQPNSSTVPFLNGVGKRLTDNCILTMGR